MTLQSFIPVSPESHFPIQNLPYGIFSPQAGGTPRVGVAIGDMVLDLAVLEEAGLFDNIPSLINDTSSLKEQTIFANPTLNPFMALGKKTWRKARQTIQSLLSTNNTTLQGNATLQEKALHPINTVTLHLPVSIGDYTDFYSSREHATNIGTMFRGKENALMPNWLHLPVAYHGRASSVVLSGTNIHRPWGQTKADDAPAPTFNPCRLMDFELEMGFFVGPGNNLGDPIPVNETHKHIFGMVLVNDWSARDIQKWEYQPLGPFLAKNLATSISPWVVPIEALEPFKCAGPAQDPPPLPYLQSKGKQAYDIHLEVALQSKEMTEPQTIVRSNFKYLYWNMCQQLAHHSITGCNMQPGDMLASGTISGPTPDSYGSMLELTWRGSKPIELPNDQIRRFIKDNDTVIMSGYCQGDGYRVGFGEVRGTILPAKPLGDSGYFG